MNKRNVLTALGIALSLVIAAGGWALTNRLIDSRTDALLSVTGRVSVDTGPVPTPDGADKQPGDLPDGRPELTGEEIAGILRVWESAGQETPHEPFGNQITMERAIGAGKAWLSALGEADVISQETESYQIGDAYLCQNLLVERDMPDPLYRYWTVSLDGREMRAVFKINAVTGQVWSAEITLTNAVTADVDVADMLNTFTAGLGLNPDESDPKAGVIYGQYEAYASQCLIDDMLYANAALRYEKYIDDKPRVLSQIKLALSSTLSFAWDQATVE